MARPTVSNNVVRRRGGWGHGVAAAVLLAALPAPAQAPDSAITRAVPASPEALQLSYSSVVKRAAPAVVNIYAAKIVRTGPRSIAELFAQQFGGATAPQRVERSLGSGVIVGADGVIVTNHHVVAGADEILVALADRREYKAKISFKDERTDIAVLRVDTGGTKLPTVELADSDTVEVGDIVLAIGDPFGFGQSVTHGIISALARNGLGISDRQFFIQTDAPINPGNSGGALLDMRGQLVGINTALFSQTGNSVGIGFAIPSNIVRVVLKAAPSGKLVTGWIGAEGEGLTPATARALGFDRATGVLVTSVSAGSPASAAGLKPGDVITAVGTTPVEDAGQFRYRIATEAIGNTIDLAVKRDGKPLTLPVKLVAPPETPPRDITPIAGNTILSGTKIANLSPAYAQQIGAGFPEHGIVVVEIARNAYALIYAGLRPGRFDRIGQRYPCPFGRRSRRRRQDRHPGAHLPARPATHGVRDGGQPDGVQGRVGRVRAAVARMTIRARPDCARTEPAARIPRGLGRFDQTEIAPSAVAQPGPVARPQSRRRTR